MSELQLNAMDLDLYFNFLGRTVFGNAYSTLTPLLFHWSVALSPFHLPFLIHQIPIQCHQMFLILILLNSLPISNPISLLPLSPLPQFPPYCLLNNFFHQILLKMNLARNSGHDFLDIPTCSRDAQMGYVTSPFLDLFLCSQLPQVQLCFYLRQTLGIFMQVSVLLCRWKQQVPSSNDPWIFFVSKTGVIFTTNNLPLSQN